MSNENILKSLSISGYRSFGGIQRFPYFSKINLFIGQNNCGKSNILNFIHDVLPTLNQKEKYKFESLDIHIPKQHSTNYGYCLNLNNEEEVSDFILSNVSSVLVESDFEALKKVFIQKSFNDNLDKVWFMYDQHHSFIFKDWEDAFTSLDDQSVIKIWSSFSGQSGGSRVRHWIPETIKKLEYKNTVDKVVMIPAIRKIGVKDSISNDYAGDGIIDKLAKLERPNALNQNDKKKFESINNFLRNVTGNPSATIEIPNERDTILVHMNERTLPLESLGTGIQEVIILAAAATTLEQTIICMEEPELHLNPILQKKLVRYLQDSTNNQYFITTHSAALMDTADAEIYHVSLVDNESVINRATSDNHKSAVCENLGYHPSDLLQTNCIIWVEGPSDRIYINYWIKSYEPKFVEGIHYSIMFYGGKLASHISGEDIEDLVEDFISLRRLNRRAIIIIDSDKKTTYSKINNTKKRLIDEFNGNPPIINCI